MNVTTKALLIGLLASAGAPAYALPATVPVASNPIQVLGADIGTVGKMSMSGIGTGTARNSVGTSNNLSLGTNSSLSIGTSLETSPEYMATGQVSATLGTANWNQTIGVTTEVNTLENDGSITEVGGNTYTGVTQSTVTDDIISGSFTGSFETTSGAASTTSSDVTLNGLSNTTDLAMAGSNLSVDTGLRTDAAIGTAENGVANASANMGLATTAAAGVSASDFSSSFIQVFVKADNIDKGTEVIGTNFYDTNLGFFDASGNSTEAYDASGNAL